MNRRFNMLSRTALLGSALLLLIAPSWATDSPFSSPEEKAFILELAGRDGLIDENDWDWEERTYFKETAWSHLIEFDLDRDRSMSLNEFIKYLATLKSEEESAKIESTGLPGRQKTVRFALDGTPIPEEAAPDAMDRSSLFRWAQITRITKFQRKVDPDEFQQVRRDLFTRRKLLRDRRRYAAAQEAVRPVEEKARFDDLFRSRIVKNRLARIAPSETPVRPSLSPSRRYSPSDSDRIRIRETQEPKELDNDQGSWEPETPTLLRAKSELPRSRGTSDIRDLIPERSAAETPAEHTANQASPAVAPAEKKTDAKVTPAKKEKPKAKKKSAAPPAQKKPIKASDASKKKQPDKQGKAQSAKKGTS